MTLWNVVFKKELKDSVRDRRSLMAGLLMPIMGPLLVAMMFTFIAKRRSQEKPIELPVIGAAHAPALISWLEQQGVLIQDPPEDPEKLIRDGDLDVVLEIPEDFPRTSGRRGPPRCA